MNIISGGRRWGKTTLLIQRFKEIPVAYLVTFNEERRKQLIEDFKLDESKVITLTEMCNRNGDREFRITPKCIDDLDVCLSTLFGFVDTAALTAGAYAWPKKRMDQILKAIRVLKPTMPEQFYSQEFLGKFTRIEGKMLYDDK